MNIDEIFPPPSPAKQHIINILTSPRLVEQNPLAVFHDYGRRIKHRLKEDYWFHRPLYPDFDEYDYRHDTSPSTPIYLNDYDINIEEDRNELARLTRLEFNGNTFMPEAMCNPACVGGLRGNHLINSGIVCKKCGNTVELSLDNQHEIGLWIKRPEGVDAFVSHSFYNTFFTAITIFKPGAPRVCVARYMIDPMYRKEIKSRSIVTEMILLDILKDLNITDISMNGFYNNCDRLMEYLIIGPGNKYTGLKDKTQDAWTFWNRYKHKAFSQYLKVPSRFSTVLEHNERGTYGVEGQPEAKNIYYAIAGCKKSNEYLPLTPNDMRRNVNLVGRKLIELSELYTKRKTSLNKRGLFHKKALSRKHVCSGNVPVTARRVVTSATGLLDPNQIVIPWKAAVSMLGVHLQSMLYRNGFTPLKALRHLNISAYKIDPLIDRFFAKMEEERKIVGKSHRNPSNEYLSLKTFWVSVCRALDDDSMRISILACATFNADFDGDQMPIRICLDNESKAKAYGGFGHHQTLDKNIPFRVSNMSSQPATHLMNLNMLMHAIKKELDDE